MPDQMLPGVMPPRANLPRQAMGQQTPVIYSPVFQRPLMAADREFPYGIVPDTNPLILTPLGNTTSQFTIEGDNDFYFETIRARFQTISTLLLCTIQLTDTRSGAQLFSAPAHIDNVCHNGNLATVSSAGLPGYMSQLDWLVAPAGSRATIRVDLANLDNATNTLWLQIQGRRQLVNPGLPRTQLS
jgi:hypothetical protein